MEKLIALHIRERMKAEAPVAGLQFAYQKGKSTVTALHHLVEGIENAIEQGEIMLCTFLDIEGGS